MMNLVMVPMWIFSGIFFSSERFPQAAQPVIKAIPLTPLIDALRSVMLEGAPLSAQLMRIGIMTAWGTVSFALALRWFRWR
jgi:ABC-type polysaccharide/polyol phosphate export permease